MIKGYRVAGAHRGHTVGELFSELRHWAEAHAPSDETMHQRNHTYPTMGIRGLLR